MSFKSNKPGETPVKPNRISVPNRYTGYVLYLSKETVQEFGTQAKKRFSSDSSSEENEESIFFLEVETDQGTRIQIERTANWEINITNILKKLNRRWRNWTRTHKGTIEVFERFEGRTLIRETDCKKNPQTFLGLVLALRVLSDFDRVISYQIMKLYEKELLKHEPHLLDDLATLRERNEVLQAENAKLKNTPIIVDLILGTNLFYAYWCNNRTKFGTSYTNKKGERPKSHKTSVPNLCIGFVVYASKKNLQELCRQVKKRFNSETEHVDCSVETLEAFVIDYCRLMNWEYVREDIHRLKLLNIYLAS